MKTGETKNSKRIIRSIIAAAVIFITALPAHGQQIARDKQLHLGAGAVVAGWGYMVPSQQQGWKPVIYGLGTATLAGVGKEVADLGGFGTPDIKDLGATIIGGAVSIGVITGVKAIIKRAGVHRRYNLFAQKNQTISKVRN